MAITFIQERKKQRYLIFILGLTIFVILLVFWWSFLKKEPAPTLSPSISKKVDINWEILKDPRLQEFDNFKEILPFEEEIGRENPSISY